MIADAPAAKVFAALDFGNLAKLMNMPVKGDGKAVGTSRSMSADGGTIVETQVYREVRDDYCAHSYNIEPGNPWNMKGYLATMSVRPLSEDPNKCFVEWVGKWESKDEGKGPADLGLGIGQIMKYACNVVAGKRKPRPEHEEALGKL